MEERGLYFGVQAEEEEEVEHFDELGRISDGEISGADGGGDGMSIARRTSPLSSSSPYAAGRAAARSSKYDFVKVRVLLRSCSNHHNACAAGVGSSSGAAALKSTDVAVAAGNGDGTTRQAHAPLFASATASPSPGRPRRSGDCDRPCSATMATDTAADCRSTTDVPSSGSVAATDDDAAVAVARNTWVLSRHVIKGRLMVAGVPATDATRIALAVKKYLVDSNMLVVDEDDLDRRLVIELEERGYRTKPHFDRYRCVASFQARRMPMAIILAGVDGMGDASIAQTVGANLNVTGILHTGLIYDVASLEQAIAAAPVPRGGDEAHREAVPISAMLSRVGPYASPHASAEEVLIDLHARCELVHRVLVTQLRRGLLCGKSMIVHGMYIDPWLCRGVMNDLLLLPGVENGGSSSCSEFVEPCIIPFMLWMSRREHVICAHNDACVAFRRDDVRGGAGGRMVSAAAAAAAASPGGNGGGVGGDGLSRRVFANLRLVSTYMLFRARARSAEEASTCARRAIDVCDDGKDGVEACAAVWSAETAAGCMSRVGVQSSIAVRRGAGSGDVDDFVGNEGHVGGSSGSPGFRRGAAAMPFVPLQVKLDSLESAAKCIQGACLERMGVLLTETG